MAAYLPLSLSDAKTDRGIALSAALLDMLLFGLVSQQYYTYWTGSFNDRIYLKVFVNVQFALVTLQSIFAWHLVFQVFVVFVDEIPPISAFWGAEANSLTQLIIIIFANTFLVIRIHGMTNSLAQSLTPMFFSIIAFVLGIVSIVGSNWMEYPQPFRYVTSAVWYVSQATAECLISFFLVRALLKARSGIQRSDSVVRFLIRNVIQIAVLASIWSIAALVAWFRLKRVTLYTFFEMTSGTVYTHAIFETLISRTQLRDRMAATSSSAYVDLEFPSGAQSRTPKRFPNHVIVSNLPQPETNSGSEPGTTLEDKNGIIELGNVPPGDSYTS